MLGAEKELLSPASDPRGREKNCTLSNHHQSITFLQDWPRAPCFKLGGMHLSSWPGGEGEYLPALKGDSSTHRPRRCNVLFSTLA